MKNAETKGEEGEVDEAQELFQQAEELQQKKAGLEAKALQASEGRTNKNLLKKAACASCIVVYFLFSDGVKEKTCSSIIGPRRRVKTVP